MKYAILPTEKHRRASRRRVLITSRRSWPQTWRFVVTLECGHETSYTRSDKNKGEHPRHVECCTCAQALAEKEVANGQGR